MKRVVRFVAVFAVGVLLGLSSCQGAACKGFCELECKRVITCTDGKNPTGAAYVNSCVDSVRTQGAKTDEDCECCSGGSTLPDGGVEQCPAGSRPCSSEPVNVWASSYSC